MSLPRGFITLAAAAGVVGALAACSSDHTVAPSAAATISPELSATLNAGFATSAAGFGETNNSFVAGIDPFAAWMPPGLGMHLDEFHGANDFMGGGLGADFAGGSFFEMGRGHGPFGGFDDASCTLNTASGRVVCPTKTMGGLTIDRSFAYTDGAGKAQAKRDDATNTVNTQVTVKGTVSHHTDTTIVSHASNQTVTGLAKTATKRVVDGTSAGTETTKGTTDKGDKFTTVRVMGDTTKGLTTPVQTTGPVYPVSGSVIRAMKVTATVGTQAPATSSRREVITYDGSATAKVIITQDGTTKNCTMPLPHGKLTCQ